MKLLHKAALIATLLSLSSIANAGNVGVVNVERVLNESEMGRTFQKAAQSLMADHSRAYQERQLAVQNLAERAAQTDASNNPDEHEAMQLAYQNALTSLNTLLQQQRQQQQQQRESAVAQMEEALGPALDYVLSKNDVDVLIRPADSLLRFAESADFTDEVIQALNILQTEKGSTR